MTSILSRYEKGAKVIRPSYREAIRQARGIRNNYSVCNERSFTSLATREEQLYPKRKPKVYIDSVSDHQIYSDNTLKEEIVSFNPFSQSLINDIHVKDTRKSIHKWIYHLGTKFKQSDNTIQIAMVYIDELIKIGKLDCIRPNKYLWGATSLMVASKFFELDYNGVRIDDFKAISGKTDYSFNSVTECERKLCNLLNWDLNKLCPAYFRGIVLEESNQEKNPRCFDHNDTICLMNFDLQMIPYSTQALACYVYYHDLQNSDPDKYQDFADKFGCKFEDMKKCLNFLNGKDVRAPQTNSRNKKLGVAASSTTTKSISGRYEAGRKRTNSDAENNFLTVKPQIEVSYHRPSSSRGISMEPSGLVKDHTRLAATRNSLAAEKDRPTSTSSLRENIDKCDRDYSKKPSRAHQRRKDMKIRMEKSQYSKQKDISNMNIQKLIKLDESAERYRQQHNKKLRVNRRDQEDCIENLKTQPSSDSNEKSRSGRKQSSFATKIDAQNASKRITKNRPSTSYGNYQGAQDFRSQKVVPTVRFEAGSPHYEITREKRQNKSKCGKKRSTYSSNNYNSFDLGAVQNSGNYKDIARDLSDKSREMSQKVLDSLTCTSSIMDQHMNRKKSLFSKSNEKPKIVEEKEGSKVDIPTEASTSLEHLTKATFSHAQKRRDKAHS